MLVQAIEATDDSPAISEHTTVETPTNMSSENKAHFLAEKEAIHLILTGIGDDIYSTVDACQTAQEMWEAIERLQQENHVTYWEILICKTENNDYSARTPENRNGHNGEAKVATLTKDGKISMLVARQNM
nr:hypothetical protein [Tanacetum cinerariifolium]